MFTKKILVPSHNKMLDYFNNSTKKTALVLFGGLLAVEIAWQIYKKSRDNKNSGKQINEVVIFSEELSECRLHANTRIPCHRSNCSVRSLRKLISYFGNSKRKLDICIYLISSEDIVKAIIKSFMRGVVVRVIIDGGMAENNACDRRIREMQEKGIRVRMKKSDHLMHHKFAIVDEELIITGSTNWTMQAFHGNWDNIIISNQKVFVEPFVVEFERMWTALTKDED